MRNHFLHIHIASDGPFCGHTCVHTEPCIILTEPLNSGDYSKNYQEFLEFHFLSNR